MTNEACFDSKLSIFAIYTFFILLLTYFTIFPTAHILREFNKQVQNYEMFL